MNVRPGGRTARLTVLVFAFGVFGCNGDEACIQWNERDGACPSRSEARRYMAPRCEEPIVSVDSDGEFDGQACCYDITKKELEYCLESSGL